MSDGTLTVFDAYGRFPCQYSTTPVPVPQRLARRARRRRRQTYAVAIEAATLADVGIASISSRMARARIP